MIGRCGCIDTFACCVPAMGSTKLSPANQMRCDGMPMYADVRRPYPALHCAKSQWRVGITTGAMIVQQEPRSVADGAAIGRQQTSVGCSAR
jgi:hypothetical protein